MSRQIPAERPPPRPPSSNSGDPGHCVQSRGESPLSFRGRVHHCHTLGPRRSRPGVRRPLKSCGPLFHSVCREKGEDAWRGSWPTSRAWLKGTPSLSCPEHLLGSRWGSVLRSQTPDIDSVAHGRAWAYVLWNSFPMTLTYMLRATPRWMSWPGLFLRTLAHVQVYLVSHWEQINQLCWEHLLLNKYPRILPPPPIFLSPSMVKVEDLSNSGQEAVGGSM